MKKLLGFGAVLLSLTLWSCSDDETPVSEVIVNKEDVVVSFEGELSEPNSSFLATEGEEDGFYMKTAFSDPQNVVSFTHYFSDWGFGGGFT